MASLFTPDEISGSLKAVLPEDPFLPKIPQQQSTAIPDPFAPFEAGQQDSASSMLPVSEVDSPFQLTFTPERDNTSLPKVQDRPSSGDNPLVRSPYKMNIPPTVEEADEAQLVGSGPVDKVTKQTMKELLPQVPDIFDSGTNPVSEALAKDFERGVLNLYDRGFILFHEMKKQLARQDGDKKLEQQLKDQEDSFGLPVRHKAIRAFIEKELSHPNVDTKWLGKGAEMSGEFIAPLAIGATAIAAAPEAAFVYGTLGTTASITSMAALMGGQGVEEARLAKATEDQINATMWLDTALGGALGGIGTGRILSKIAPVTDGLVYRSIVDAVNKIKGAKISLDAIAPGAKYFPKVLDEFRSKTQQYTKVGLETLQGAVELGLLNAATTLGYNKVAQENYDPERTLTEGVKESAEQGGGIGLILHGLAGLVGMHKTAGRFADPETVEAARSRWEEEGRSGPATTDLINTLPPGSPSRLQLEKVVEKRQGLQQAGERAAAVMSKAPVVGEVKKRELTPEEQTEIARRAAGEIGATPKTELLSREQLTQSVIAAGKKALDETDLNLLRQAKDLGLETTATLADQYQGVLGELASVMHQNAEGTKRIVDVLTPGEVVQGQFGTLTPSDFTAELRKASSPKELMEAIEEGNIQASAVIRDTHRLMQSIVPMLRNPITGQLPAISFTPMSTRGVQGSAGALLDSDTFGVRLNPGQLRRAAAAASLARVARGKVPESYQHDLNEAAVAFQTTAAHEIGHVFVFSQMHPYEQALQGRYEVFPEYAIRKAVLNRDRADGNIGNDLYNESYAALTTEFRNKLQADPRFLEYQALKRLHGKFAADNQREGRTVLDYQLAAGDIADFLAPISHRIDSAEFDVNSLFEWEPTPLKDTPMGSFPADGIPSKASDDALYYQEFQEFTARLMAGELIHLKGQEPLADVAVQRLRQNYINLYDKMMGLSAFSEFRLPIRDYLEGLSLEAQVAGALRKRLSSSLSPISAVARLDVQTGKLHDLKDEQKPRRGPPKLSMERIPESHAVATGKEPPVNSEVTEQDFRDWDTNLDKFNKFYSWGINILNLGNLNPHLRLLQNYINDSRAWANATGELVFLADTVHTQWIRLGKKQTNALSEILLEETLAGSYKSAADVFKHLDDNAIFVKEQIQDAFEQVLKQMEGVMIEKAIRTFSQDPVAQGNKILEIQNKIIQLRNKPFFPLMRFGKHALQIRNAEGKQIYFESFESSRERDAAVKDWRRRRDQTIGNTDLQKATVTAIEMSDHMMSVQGLPRDFVDLYIETLDAAGNPLSPEQIRQLKELSFEQSQANGFMRQFKKRKGIAGFSTDGPRVFANYMQMAANHIARVKYAPRLSKHIQDLRRQTAYIRKTDGERNPTIKRDQIADWLEEHFKYLTTPANEWSGLRSAAFFLNLGFNLKSAVLNTMQVPQVTYPFLAARFGDGKTIAALLEANKIAMQFWRKGPETLDPEIVAMLKQGQAENWLDEGVTTELALSARSDRLDRVQAKNIATRFIRTVPQKSAIFFQTAEKINRRVTAIAAYNLYRRSGADVKRALFLTQQAVETTQFDMARWNRAPIFRGKKGVALVFMGYTQNVLAFALTDPGKWRWLMIQLYLGGLLGLPFAQNILDLISGGWNFFQRALGTHKSFKDFEIELRRMLKATVGEMGLNPDLILHGSSRDSFGLTSVPVLNQLPLPHIDMSGSIGMGRILPLTRELKNFMSGGSLNDFLAQGGVSAGGAGAGSLYSILQAAASSDPNTWRRVEKGLPAFLRSASQGYRLFAEGGETTQRGDKIAVFDPFSIQDRAELIMKAMGFQPTKLSLGWEKELAQREVAAYYQIQKSLLLKDLNYAKSINDQEGIADVTKAIKNYNANVPYPEMGITRKQAKQSWNSYKRTFERAGQDAAMSRSYERLENELKGVFDPYDE